MGEPNTIAVTLRALDDLPSLPTVVERLLSILQNPDYTSRDVGTAIGSDQALAARILKLVNSPAYGFSQDIQTIDRAVVILGSDALQNLVLCAGVAGAVEAMGVGGGLQAFWRHSLYVAAGSRLLAERTGTVSPDEAFLGGLVHDLGELALSVVKPHEYQRVLALGSRDRLLNEKRYVGLTHQRAGHILLSAWCLPEQICEIARMHHSRHDVITGERPILSVVALADLLSRVAGMGVESPASERLLVPLLRTVGLSMSDVADVLHGIDMRMAEKSSFLGLGTEVLGSDAAANSPGELRIVLLSTSKRRVLWLQQVVSYLNHENVPLKEFFQKPEETDLVLLDPGSLGRIQLQKIAPYLVQSRAAVAVCGDASDDVVTEILHSAVPRLSLVFSPRELDAILTLAPTR